MELIEGYVYRDTSKTTRVKEVVYKWSAVGVLDPKIIFDIVHEVGEPDMQSCYGLNPGFLEGPIRQATSKDLGIVT